MSSFSIGLRNFFVLTVAVATVVPSARVKVFNGTKYKDKLILPETQNLCDSTGCVGDIKYSILKPSVFSEKFPGWVLLSGNTDRDTDDLFKNSKLHKTLGVASLPDARGVFIRGMNEGRSIETGNPDGDKPVGTPQTDALRNHIHTIKNIHWQASGGNNVSVSILNPSDPGFSSNATSDYTTGELFDINKQGIDKSTETRPRNIALYAYIKIN